MNDNLTLRCLKARDSGAFPLSGIYNSDLRVVEMPSHYPLDGNPHIPSDSSNCDHWPRKAYGYSGGKRVLIFATRQDRDQLAMIATLAWALIRRGHTPIILGCDGILTKSCNYGYYPSLSPWICRSCALYAQKTHALTGLTTMWLGDLVSKEIRAEAKQRIGSISPEDYPHFSYKGCQVGRFVRHSVAHFLRTGKIMQEPS